MDVLPLLHPVVSKGNSRIAAELESRAAPQGAALSISNGRTSAGEEMAISCLNPCSYGSNWRDDAFKRSGTDCNNAVTQGSDT
jgi:hypothetical protein